MKWFTFDALRNQEARNNEILLFSADSRSFLARSTFTNHSDRFLLYVRILGSALLAWTRLVLELKKESNIFIKLVQLKSKGCVL